MKTDDDLKRMLAKMLPDKLEMYIVKEEPSVLCWKGSSVVEDDELLQICWEIEEELVYLESIKYEIELNKMIMLNANKHFKLATSVLFDWHATWQQRATALAKVKGIEL